MPRRLRPDEQELWQRVASTTSPLRTPDRSAAAPPDAATPAPKPIKAKPRQNIDIPTEWAAKAGPEAPTRFRPAPDPFVPLAEARPRMDAKAHARLKRGKIKPEARLDLHGLTMAEARPALTGFLMRQAAQGARLVLVITGKGRGGPEAGPLPVRRGALKHAVPEWLAMAPLSALVLQAVPAHPRHGGQGALYVYLRKNARS